MLPLTAIITNIIIPTGGTLIIIGIRTNIIPDRGILIKYIYILNTGKVGQGLKWDTKA